uniref:Uncharacterized protein n=1 Tax=Romanomermis culicivorax TaxID=13658 RepID=A0A915HHW9_ROMCU
MRRTAPHGATYLLVDYRPDRDILKHCCRMAPEIVGCLNSAAFLTPKLPPQSSSEQRGAGGGGAMGLTR